MGCRPARARDKLIEQPNQSNYTLYNLSYDGDAG